MKKYLTTLAVIAGLLAIGCRAESASASMPQFVANTPPTVTLASGAGAGATVHIQGSDASGSIQLFTGSAPRPGTSIFTVQLSAPITGEGAVFIFQRNEAGASVLTQIVPIFSTADTWVLYLRHGASLEQYQDYRWSYLVVDTP